MGRRARVAGIVAAHHRQDSGGCWWSLQLAERTREAVELEMEGKMGSATHDSDACFTIMHDSSSVRRDCNLCRLPCVQGHTDLDVWGTCMHECLRLRHAQFPRTSLWTSRYVPRDHCTCSCRPPAPVSGLGWGSHVSVAYSLRR